MSTSNQASSFFGSPRFFTGFSIKGSSETESVMSPTSILDSKSYTAFINPFWSDKSTNSTTNTTSRLSSKGVGLAIVDALNDEETNKKLFKPDSRIVLFGSQLKIQIPSSVLVSPTVSPKSPADFGIKTRNSQLGSSKSPFEMSNSGLEAPSSPQFIPRCLSASEMEMSEDYTCVISRGANPKTIHIFGDCIVENCCGVVGFSSSKNEACLSKDSSPFSSKNFLSFCYNCNKKLGEGKDIYMYRGEKAFCSRECRHQEMLINEGKEKTSMEDSFRACS